MNVAAVFFAVGFVLTLPIFAQQYKLCCPCKAADGKRFVGMTVPSLPNACAVACSANQGSSIKTERSWLVDKDASCGFNPPVSTPRQATPTNVLNDAKYSISHQGARVWTGGEGAEMIRGEQLRKSLTGVDMDRSALQASPIDVLEQATREATAQCVAERPIENDFVWVCKTQRRSGDIHNLLNQPNYDEIRSIFSNTQAHDDQLRNRIYCRNNAQIAQLVRSSCPAADPPPPPQDRRRDH